MCKCGLRNLRLVDGNKNKVLLEQIHVPGPRLDPVVLLLLDPERPNGEFRSAAGGKVKVRKVPAFTHGRLAVSGTLRRSLWFSLL